MPRNLHKTVSNHAGIGQKVVTPEFLYFKIVIVRDVGSGQNDNRVDDVPGVAQCSGDFCRKGQRLNNGVVFARIFIKIDIHKINSEMMLIEKQISDMAEGLKNVVTKSELADMMNSFISDDDNWLMYNAKFSSADEVFESIYGQAKKSIYVVDNYIGLRTLVHFKNSPDGVSIILFSDNVGTKKLHSIEFSDFRKEYPTVNISMKKTGGIFHDRFIVLDYGTDNERVFLCGASSKDAGARITSIVEDFGVEKYKAMVNGLLNNEALVLP